MITVDLNDYRSDSLVTIKEYPRPIGNNEFVNFLNFDPQAFKVYFKTPINTLIGPCESGCYLQTGVSIITATIGHGRRCSIVTVELQNKALVYTFPSIAYFVYTVEDGLQQKISFGFNLRILCRVNPDSQKIKELIDAVVFHKIQSVNAYIEAEVRKNLQAKAKEYVNQEISSSNTPTTFSDLAELITHICNNQTQLQNDLNKELTKSLKYFIVDVESLIIDIPEESVIRQNANARPKTVFEGELRTMSATIDRVIKGDDMAQELKGRLANALIDEVKNDPDRVAHLLEVMMASGIEGNDMQGFIDCLSHQSRVDPKLIDVIQSIENDSSKKYIE